MKKVILFFNDSASSINVNQLIINSKNTNFYIFVYKDSPAYSILFKHNLILLDNILNTKQYIKNINPDFIYIGTSWQNKTHLAFIKYAQQLNIPSIVAMDHWVNYKERFSFPDKNWENNLPEFITVNDKFAYNIAKRIGFKNIKKLKFDTLINDINKYKNNNIKEKNKLLFISEPTKDVAYKTYNDEKYWGFNEYDIIENICKNLHLFQTKDITIRLHPSDKIGKYDYLKDIFNNIKIKIENPYENNLTNSIISSKIVIGIDGFALYQAKIFGKISISYIPNKKRKCFVPLFKNNYIDNLNNINIQKFKKKESIKEVEEFGLSFENILDNINVNKSLSASVIGCGNIGGLYDTKNSKEILSHAHAYKINTNTHLDSCCDINLNNIIKFKNNWGSNIKAYDNLEKLLKKEKVDIISIATDTNTHFNILHQIIKKTNTKYILCEKPFVSSILEFKKIKKLLKNSNIKLQINFIRCFDKSFNKIKKIISKNKLGNVISFNARFNKGIYHNGSHMLSLIEHLIDNINSVYVSNKTICENDIYGNFIINLKNNISGTLTNDKNINYSFFELEIILKYGVIKIENSGFNISIYKLDKNNKLYFHKKLKNTLKNYALSSLNNLIYHYNEKQFNDHLNISKKLLLLRDNFLNTNTTKVNFEKM